MALQGMGSLLSQTNDIQILSVKVRESYLIGNKNFTHSQRKISIVHLMKSTNTYFLVMNPKNQVGKKPLRTMSGT